MAKRKSTKGQTPIYKLKHTHKTKDRVTRTSYRRKNDHNSDIKYKPDLPLSGHLLSSSQNNAVALQDLKIKIIETTLTGMRSQDRLVKVFGSENCNH